MSLAKAPAANYRVTIDGMNRTNHDDRAIAIEIAKHRKDRNRGSDIKVYDIHTGSLVADIGWAVQGASFMKGAT